MLASFHEALTVKSGQRKLQNAGQAMMLELYDEMPHSQSTKELMALCMTG